MASAEKAYFISEEEGAQRQHRYQKWLIATGMALFLLVITVIALSVLVASARGRPEERQPSSQPKLSNPANKITTLPWPEPSNSALGKYAKAAISSDNGLCAEVGRRMLVQGGTAMDAIIATNICQGGLNSQSSGIGGGFFLNYYDRLKRRCTTIDARETAPLDISQLDAENVKIGEKGIGVPGEISGMWKGHQMFGKLPWKDLFLPTIRYLRDGFPASGAFAGVLNSEWVKPHVKPGDPNNLEIFWNNKTQRLYQEGEILRRPVLADTLEQLAHAPDPVALFYKGVMGKQLVKEIQDTGGVLTEEDFVRYEAKVEHTPMAMEIPGTGMVICGPNPPSSASIIAAFLNILSGMNISPQNNLTTIKDASDMYNNMVEAMKFSYAARSFLGDPAFQPSANQNITSPRWGKVVQKLIPDQAKSAWYYGGNFLKFDRGTTHMSVIDQSGNAAALSSSVNWYFGALRRSKYYGIVWNNQLADFSFDNTVDDFGFAPTDSNKIKPGKRPLSSMSPVIIYNPGTGDPHLVLGAAGGSRIISVVAYVASRVLWLNETIKQAVDAPRFHNQLTPNTTKYEQFMPQVYADHLRDDHGQTIKKDDPREISVVCGLHRHTDGIIYANSDFRKPGGYSAGY